MDLAFPEKYYQVAKYFDVYIGNVEETPLLTDTQRLMFYALRQQAEHGPCTTPTPSVWYLTERHKQQAWKQLGNMSTFEAMVFFVQQFERVLQQLENPAAAPSASDASSCTGSSVDWPARLRDMAPGPATEQASDGAPQRGSSVTGAAATAAPGPSTAVTPEEQPARPAAAEMAGWDADIIAHAAATADNICYLAAELMRARHALRVAQETVASHMATHSRAGASIDGPPTQESLSGGLAAASSNSATCGPPLKPIWGTDGNGSQTAIVPPPLRLSARLMTEAAVRQPQKMPTMTGTSTTSARPGGLDASAAWFTW
ncbi:Acyl CoA binding protein [Novymonas esmeraldas]|uniref:Acyl CoA binding protein n=1 Tax=Novymonas esmeraldas TaxID=1808958 RepID=A0AAW0FEV0_9TRYP